MAANLDLYINGTKERTLNFPADVDDLDLKLRVPTLGQQVSVSSYDIVSNQPL